MKAKLSSFRLQSKVNIEQLYQFQVEELADYAMFLIDTDGVIASWNAGVRAVLQYEREDFIGRPLAELFTVEDRAAGMPEKEMATAAEQGRSSDVRWHLRKDGSRVFIDGVMNAVRDEDSQVVGLSKVMRDATKRHDAELALKRSRDDLAEFAHVVSHDLQAPLRTMRSYAQLLSKRYQGKLDEDADIFLSFILEAARNMEELIHGLLQYAEFGEEEERQHLSLGNLLDAVLTALQAQIDETGAEIISGELPTLEINPRHVQQVFQNLIGNAIKYRSSAEPRIQIEASQNDREWVISVSDNGVGIAPEYYDRVFLPLKRLHGQEIPGTGLGLSVCKRIVERNGGRIWVESKPGRGSTFRFTIPIAMRRA